MKNIQFNFSVFVGLALNALGAVILQKDPAGLGLVITGVALLTLTFFTKKATDKALTSESV